MSKQPRNLTAVFDRLRRRMLSAQSPADGRGNVESEPARRSMPATPIEAPPRLPVRATAEYVHGGRVDSMRRLIRDR